MKQIFTLFLTACFSMTLWAQDAGIFQADIILDFGQGAGSEYFAANDYNPDNNQGLGGIDFGTISQITLQGGQLKTFKNNGGDVTAAEMSYCIYEAGSSCTSFTTQNLSFTSDLGGGNQLWDETSLNIDLVSTLSPSTNYVIEVFWKASTNVGDRFASGGGNNYLATFTTDTNLSTQNFQRNTKQSVIASNQLVVAEDGQYNLSVYNANGQMVKSVRNLNLSSANPYNLGLSAGFYVVQLEQNGKITNIKTVVK